MAQARRFVLEYALASSWISWGCEPESFLGYSLGELTAASVAGLIGFDEALDLVIRHAELVDALPQGRMLAVCMRADEVAALNFPEIYLLGNIALHIHHCRIRACGWAVSGLPALTERRLAATLGQARLSYTADGAGAHRNHDTRRERAV